MFNPRYRLLISCKSFPADQFICLGSQLIFIVNLLKNILPAHVWYGADVDAVGEGAKELDINGFRLNLVGTDQELVQYCSKITQFIWGVFVCIDRNYSPLNFQDIQIETEDEPFRSISCAGILIEIRTFDTSYFEVYSEDEKIIKYLSEKIGFSELIVK